MHSNRSAGCRPGSPCWNYSSWSSCRWTPLWSEPFLSWNLLNWNFALSSSDVGCPPPHHVLNWMSEKIGHQKRA